MPSTHEHGPGPVDRTAAAHVLWTHQRRHPSSPGCCCAWMPGRPGETWVLHVLAELDRIGVLATRAGR